MKTTSNFAFGQLMLRSTEATDLDFILASEQHRDNSLFIRQWSAEQHLAALEDANVGHFVILGPDDYRPIGHVILVGLNDPDLTLELRRIVITEKGRGYGRMAMRMIRAYAFEELACHRLWLDVMLYNKRAYKLYKSEGFKVEGIHRGAVRQGSRFLDVRVMSMLRREYYDRYQLQPRPTRLLPDCPCTGESGRLVIV
ncbi:MAG: GNAT family N-acetyltransferase [Candidatus Zixiibacteriota bacterium]|nr:MAG: GNAT family N-acetyltransferase [candidate division Zixibacteria bacterium]